MGDGAEGASEVRTILVVDDTPEILSLIDRRLQRLGFRVLTAGDGEAALEMARTHLPDLIVLDIMMPKRNGWEVARALKRDPATQACRIIVLSAIGEQVNQLTSPIYGADAFLDKPFDFEDLEQMIREQLAAAAAAAAQT